MYASLVRTVVTGLELCKASPAACLGVVTSGIGAAKLSTMDPATANHIAHNAREALTPAVSSSAPAIQDEATLLSWEDFIHLAGTRRPPFPGVFPFGLASTTAAPNQQDPCKGDPSKIAKAERKLAVAESQKATARKALKKAVDGVRSRLFSARSGQGIRYLESLYTDFKHVGTSLDVLIQRASAVPTDLQSAVSGLRGIAGLRSHITTAQEKFLAGVAKTDPEAAKYLAARSKFDSARGKAMRARTDLDRARDGWDPLQRRC